MLRRIQNDKQRTEPFHTKMDIFNFMQDDNNLEALHGQICYYKSFRVD